jgi:hypothetical protein
MAYSRLSICWMIRSEELDARTLGRIDGLQPLYGDLWRFSKRVRYFVGEGFRPQVSGFSKR